MPGSKSSQNTCNCVVALLALWSMVSLIVIVVWATWPHVKNMAQCEAAQRATTEKMEGAKVIWAKEKSIFQDLLEQSRENQSQLQREVVVIVETLRDNNRSLTGCLQEQMILNDNTTVLENEIDMHETVQESLYSKQVQQEAHVDELQLNLTGTLHQWDSCTALRSAASSQQVAAESQRKACESRNKYLLKRRDGCKIEDSDVSHHIGKTSPGL